MTDLSNIGEFPIYIAVAIFVTAAFLIRIFIVPLFSRFDEAYPVATAFIQKNEALRNITGPIVETKELPIAGDYSAEYRRYDFSVTGEQMSGILKCGLIATTIGWDMKWRMKKATFVPENGEEIELKV